MTSVRIVGNELLVGKERVRPLAKISPEQAMKLTCYGSLAFCCDLSRECHLRDEAIRLLGMTKEEFRAIQNECHQQFIRYGERRWPQEQISSSNSDFSTSRSYSRDQSQEPNDSWREPTTAKRYEASRSASQGSGGAVDLGGLFSEPEEYRSRSLQDPEPFSSISTRLGSDSRSHTSDGWLSSGSTAAMPTPSHTSTPGFCIYCGQDLHEGSEFCNRCGRNQQ